MLERCFVRPETLERIQCCWLGPAIARYGTWLCESGYRVKTLAARVSILRQFGAFAQTHGAQTYEELPKHVEPFLQFWIQRPDPRRASERLLQVTRRIRIAIEQMLRVVVPGFVGRPRQQAIPEPFADRAPGFSSYLRQERGLRDTILGLYGEHLRAFAAWLTDAGHEDLQELSPAMVSDFLTERSQHLSRSTLRARCAVLRVFLRYLYRERLITRDLSLIVEAAPCYRLAHLPRSITVEDVRKLLDSIDRGTVLGRRDYAMLLLLVTYGLRAREVAALTLEDIEWRHDRLRIPARKADHSSAYPLSPFVGAAILEYLKAGRPATSLRQVFFHVTAPCTPITQAAVSSRAAHYLHQSGIVGPRLGSHTFRHSCVQRLVDAGWSLKAIGDYVGHASPASTEIYSKVAVETLREIAIGLRPGEAVRLRDADVELEAAPPRMTIRETKFRKSRLVPVDSSTADALRKYASTRKRLGYDGLAQTFFVSESGAPLAYSTVGATFLKMVRGLGLHGPVRSFGPNLRCLRHTFAVRRLLHWYRQGMDVN